MASFKRHLSKTQEMATHSSVLAWRIRGAVESGQLEKTRYDSYLRLYEKAEKVKLWELNK